MADGVWVSAVLLVLFPIALQVGFVFIGGQAGRLLDVRQMKALFPRIVSGFAVGFLVGGLLGIPLLALLGSTEHLLVATTAAQLAFLGLLLVTERRFPEVRAVQADDAPAIVRPPLRTLFASGIALLLLVYQVLSAMGSWIVDFLLFDRAAARYREMTSRSSCRRTRRCSTWPTSSSSPSSRGRSCGASACGWGCS